MSKVHLADLDGLRGVAALAVVTHHMVKPFGFELIPNAHLAVDFFFALSGFVIALSYEKRLISGTLTLRSFFGSRLRRLHPLIILGLILGAGVYVLRFGFSPDVVSKVVMAYALGLALIPTAILVGPGYVASQPLNMPMWSLLAEYAVNIFYALFAPRLTRPIVLALCALGAISSLSVLYLFGTLDVGYSYDDWWWGIMRVIFPFFAGVAIYRHWESHNRALAGAPFKITAVALIACLILPSWTSIQSIIVIAVLPSIVLFSSSASSMAKTGLKYWVGYLSYPVYVIHFPVVRIFSNVIRKLSLTGPALFIAFVAEMVVILILSYLVARFYDEPLRAWLNRKQASSPRGLIGEGAYQIPLAEPRSLGSAIVRDAR